MHRTLYRVLLLCFLWAASPLLSSCSDHPEREGEISGAAAVGGSTSGAPQFAVTIHPLAAILDELVGDRASVVTLLPAGASPHTYDPRPSDVRKAADALAFFYVSDMLDGWASSLPAGRRIAALDLVPVPNRLTMGEFPHSHDSSYHDAAATPENHSEKGDDTWDPHFWMDPLTVKASLPAFVEALGKTDPEGRATYETNARRFAAELDDLDQRVRALLAPVRDAPVVLYHPSVRYLLHRYDLRLFRVVETSPGKEPTPRYILDLATAMKQAGVKAVFTEPQLPARPIEVIAEAAGVPIRTLDPVGGDPGRRTYSELILFNAETLENALK